MTAPSSASSKASASTGSQQKVHSNESTAIKFDCRMRNISPFFAISLILLFIAFLAAFPNGAEARAFPMNFESMEDGGNVRTVEKRRLVVRVPFAQNPDGHQLSRIYKSLFEPSNSRAKKQPWTYSLRHFVAGPEEE